MMLKSIKLQKVAAKRACMYIQGHMYCPSSLYTYMCNLCFSLQIAGCMWGGGVYVCTRVRDRVVICMPFVDGFYLSCCMYLVSFSKHRATTLRSNLQQFNRPGKDLHVMVIEFYATTEINCWSFMWEGGIYHACSRTVGLTNKSSGGGGGSTLGIGNPCASHPVYKHTLT